MLTRMGKQDCERHDASGYDACLTKPVRWSGLPDYLASVVRGETLAGRSTDPNSSIRHLGRRESRILLVEDNVVNQQVALSLLKKMGISADCASSGVEALKILESNPYDLVLMDCMMPELDGYETAARIRNRESSVLNHGIPIIAMTANAMQGDREKCLNAGMNDYLVKPVSPKMLAEKLISYLPVDSGAAPAECSKPGPGDQTGSGRANASAQVFDKGKMLESLDHDEKLGQDMIAQFIDSTSGEIRKLGTLLEEMDAKGIQRLAHSIKGAAAYMGAQILREVAYQTELAAKGGDLTSVPELLKNLDDQFQLFLKAAEREYPTLFTRQNSW
jgi:two-component system sensor histidine kinase/response regulator